MTKLKMFDDKHDCESGDSSYGVDRRPNSNILRSQTIKT